MIVALANMKMTAEGMISFSTADFFRHIHADKVFLSTQGVNELGELTVPKMTDAHVKQALMRAGRQKSCWRTEVNLVKRSLRAMVVWPTLTSLSARPACP